MLVLILLGMGLLVFARLCNKWEGAEVVPLLVRR